MELRTTFSIEPSARKITYYDPVMFVGSCFASSIGMQMAAGRMPVLINPAGTVYNPVSVYNTIGRIIYNKECTEEDLYNYEGTWLSFNHYTDFVSEDPSELAGRINKSTREAFDFLSSSRFLFITFGTARVYIWKKTGTVVSNCHKIPSAYFESRLLGVDEIAGLWRELLDRLHSLFPELLVIFTVSPVRHWKDGAHGNQLSKSVLFLAVEELLCHPSVYKYFPAYELVMDDLRDYRFYDTDMLHLSPAAIDYIWEAFAGCFIEKKALDLWREVSKVTRAVNHKITTTSSSRILEFAGRMLDKIDTITKKAPSVCLDEEKEYFRGLFNKSHK
jgi:hypothetical protein